MRFAPVLTALVAVASLAPATEAQQRNCEGKHPPTLPPNSRWVPNENCTSGPVYETVPQPQERCRCWGHCGYICSPKQGGGGSNTTRRPAPTTKKQSPCPHGPIWYNPQGQRCYCQSHNKQPYYVCEATTTTSTTTTTTTTESSDTTTDAASG